MNVMEIIEQAQADVDRLKKPGVREFRKLIDPISIAAGEGGTGDDEIVSINITKHHRFLLPLEAYLIISMVYEVRCCAQSRKIEIPLRVVMAENPVLAAKIWKAELDVATAKRKMMVAIRDSHSYSNDLNKATEALKALTV